MRELDTVGVHLLYLHDVWVDGTHHMETHLDGVIKRHFIQICYILFLNNCTEEHLCPPHESKNQLISD